VRRLHGATGLLVDIFAAGPQLYHLTAGRSLPISIRFLDILAHVESTEHAPFEQLEPEIAAHLGQITTVICVFLDWTTRRRAFVQHLLEQGAAGKSDHRARWRLHQSIR
jgi:hypothetical protein